MKIKIWNPDLEGEEDAVAQEVLIASGNTLENQLQVMVQDFAERDYTESDYWKTAVVMARIDDGPPREFEASSEQTVTITVAELRKS